jgi:protein arginine N-methyltransferase 1
MLKDSVRTKSYRAAILQNRHLFKDKIVLDVGCGTGILSMFAAQAGAAHVYAVDMSDIIKQAHHIVHANGFGTKITCIQGRIEDIELPVEKVDVIVSEWMGYFLVYENMLKTVLIARDRWLKPGGVMMPDRANLYFCAIEDAKYKDDKINWWENVYGFNMSIIRDLAVKEPIVDVVGADAVNTTAPVVWSMDINTISVADLDFSFSFDLEVTRDDYAHALVGFWDVEFSRCHTPIRFSTGPFSDYTHWKQTVFYLPEVLPVSQGDVFHGEMHVFPNAKNNRDMNVSLKYNLAGKYGPFSAEIDYIIR